MNTERYWKLLKQEYNNSNFVNPEDFLKEKGIKYSKKVLKYKW